MLRINSDSPGAAARLNVTDKEGETAKVFGIPIWKSDNEAIATVTPAVDGMSAVVNPVSEGDCNVTVTLEGAEEVGTDSLTATAAVSVVSPEATQASITFGPAQ